MSAYLVSWLWFLLLGGLVAALLPVRAWRAVIGRRRTTGPPDAATMPRPFITLQRRGGVPLAAPRSSRAVAPAPAVGALAPAPVLGSGEASAAPVRLTGDDQTLVAPVFGAAYAADARHDILDVPLAAALFYLELLVIAELLVNLHPVAGLCAHLTILALLLFHASRTNNERLYALLVMLGMAPVTRIISFVMPLGQVPVIWRYAMAAFPVAVSVTLAARAVGFGAGDAGARLGRPARRRALLWLPTQIAVASIGVPLGLAEYAILQPDAIVSSSSTLAIALAAVILLVSTGFAEELLFRGLLQTASSRLIGTRAAIVYVSAVFAAMHIGYRSYEDLAFVFGVGLLFSLIVSRLHSVIGVSLAHGLTNFVLLVVAPLTIGGGGQRAPIELHHLQAPPAGYEQAVAIAPGAIAGSVADTRSPAP